MKNNLLSEKLIYTGDSLALLQVMDTGNIQMVVQIGRAHV